MDQNAKAARKAATQKSRVEAWKLQACERSLKAGRGLAGRAQRPRCTGSIVF